jgi:hypothetical protein
MEEEGWKLSTHKNHKEGKKIIAIPRDEFYKHKNDFTEVTRDLSDKFDAINKLFLTSTQYINNKSRVNFNHLNHCKWQDSSNETSGENALRQLKIVSEANMDKIIGELYKITISDYDELKSLAINSVKLFTRNDKFIKVHCKVIHSILCGCKWIAYNNDLIPVTYRICVMDEIERRFYQIIDDDEKVRDLTVSEKKILFELILGLFKEKVMGTQCMRFIFNIIETKYIETHNDELISFWHCLYKGVVPEWKGNNADYINDRVKFVNENREQFGTRGKLLTKTIK